MSVVFSAFTLACLLFEIPSALGNLGGLVGPVVGWRWTAGNPGPCRSTSRHWFTPGGAFAWLANDPTRPISQMSD